MLRPRIIPCLLIHKGGLVKTTKFRDHKYIGDPLNTVRIFNEKQVDEIVVADIDATSLSREPDYDLIAKLASECRMPLCYVGGVKTAEQFERIISLGVEKIGISSAAVENESLISEASARVGKQSIVVVIDVKKVGILRRYEVFTHNGKKSTGLSPIDFVERAISMGAGEIIINSIDNDGAMKGYCYELIDQLIDSVKVPFSILGGAGSFSDLKDLINRYGVVGASAGSIFVFKGKYRAVLIQYPSMEEKLNMFKALKR